MKDSSHQFTKNAATALVDKTLQQALTNIETGFVRQRHNSIEDFPPFEDFRDYGKQIKNHSIRYLSHYLKQFEANVIANGGHVHWASDDNEACQIAVQLCAEHDAKLVTKSKSMVSEEIDLNTSLEQAGIDVVETDLGEYIIQIRGESPSHIVAPALHVLKKEVTEDFKRQHQQFDPERDLESARNILNEAREVLREQFQRAKLGFTGANFLIAESGSVLINTNEGNADLTHGLADCHVVITGIEKVVPRFQDAFALMRLLTRSATGQAITTYATVINGPKRAAEKMGPKAFHIILVDNGRSDLIGSENQEILRCIRCGACLNHCPIYKNIGGKAYGWVYPGPMGSVLTPHFRGQAQARDLANASTFCGRCQAVCPVRIPLPKLLRHHREQQFKEKIVKARTRWALVIWAFFAKRPRLYHFLMARVVRYLHRKSLGKGVIKRLAFAYPWLKHRDFPAPSGKTFHQLWHDKHE